MIFLRDEKKEEDEKLNPENVPEKIEIATVFQEIDKKYIEVYFFMLIE